MSSAQKISSPKLNNHRRRRSASAFTLIELLTVIAIIAILAAIIFPVFAAVRENARRGACISNMREISSAIKLYELDNRKSADFLLTPAILAGSGANSKNGCALTGPASGAGSDKSYLIAAGPGDTVCTLDQASGTGKLGQQIASPGGTVEGYVSGLYPEYVRSLRSFHCPNNTEYDLTNAGTTADVTAPLARYNSKTDPDPNATGTYGTATDQVAFRFYKFDSYDANPIIDTSGTGDNLTKNYNPTTVAFTTRYATQWLPTIFDEPTPSTNKPYSDLLNGNAPYTGADLTKYTSQLRWREPGDDTYVTMCSWHAPKTKMVALFANGTARVLDVRRVNQVAPHTTGGNVDSAINTDFDGYKLKP